MEPIIIATSLLVVGVAILAVLGWFTHREVGVLHRDFVTLTGDMRTDRQVMSERLDRAVERMDHSTAACNRAADACQSMADSVRLLVQHEIMRDRPQPGPAE
jgi:hypothetical protein